MSKPNSTAPATNAKPTKPNPQFPLFPHASGQWAKKIRGKLHYFGKWDNPDAALTKYNEQKEALHAGRKPREETAGFTVNQLLNKFRNAKLTLRDNGELSALMYIDYVSACDCVTDHFGKSRLVTDLDPEDFAALRKKLAKKWGFHRLAKTIQCIRSIFKFGFDAGFLDKPVRFGPGFKKPSKKTMRLHRVQQGVKLFTADEIRRMVDGASQPLKAMVLLGINCGYGNADCGQLEKDAVNLDTGIIDFPRPKTGLQRRCALWPETVEAIRDALANRYAPKDAKDERLVFLTHHGHSWFTGNTSGPLPHTFEKLLNKLGINGRKGLTFYTLRHTFRTIADEARDQPACDFIMGHESPHMSSVYRERIGDERLKAVTDHVRTWLFPSAAFLSSATTPIAEATALTQQ